MNIKEASETTGVSADTIRYYERIGLIPNISRNENGVRKFDEEDLRWIDFSRQMRRAGISIEALIDYLALFREGEKTLESRMELLKEQRAELQDRIDMMQEALERLDFKIENYDTHLIPAQKKLKEF